MSLALSTLLYEWRRYMAAIIAIALAGVLMLALGALFIGIMQSSTASIDKSRGQIIILSAQSTSLGGFGGGSSLPKRVVPLIYRHPDVVEVQDLPGDFGMFYGPGAQQPSPVNVMVIDTSPDGVTLPIDFTDEMRRAIEPPYAVGIDVSAQRQLNVKLGDQAMLNGRTVKVALIMEGYANSQFANLIMSRQTQRLMSRQNDEQLGLLMVRVKNAKTQKDIVRIRDELNALANGQYRAWTKEELATATINEMTRTGFLAMILLFISVIGFVIGVVITWQTLRGAILANIKEFASLRALGVSIGQLRGVVMELSFWVGILGILAAALLMAGITALAASFSIPMGYQIDSLISTAILLLLIAVGSGMLTLGALKKGEPADLLK